MERLGGVRCPSFVPQDMRIAKKRSFVGPVALESRRPLVTGLIRGLASNHVTPLASQRRATRTWAQEITYKDGRVLAQASKPTLRRAPSLQRGLSKWLTLRGRMRNGRLMTIRPQRLREKISLIKTRRVPKTNARDRVHGSTPTK